LQNALILLVVNFYLSFEVRTSPLKMPFDILFSLIALDKVKPEATTILNLTDK